MKIKLNSTVFYLCQPHWEKIWGKRGENEIDIEFPDVLVYTHDDRVYTHCNQVYYIIVKIWIRKKIIYVSATYTSCN